MGGGTVGGGNVGVGGGVGSTTTVGIITVGIGGEVGVRCARGTAVASSVGSAIVVGLARRIVGDDMLRGLVGVCTNSATRVRVGWAVGTEDCERRGKTSKPPTPTNNIRAPTAAIIQSHAEGRWG